MALICQMCDDEAVVSTLCLCEQCFNDYMDKMAADYEQHLREVSA